MIPDRSAIMNAVPGTQVAKSLASLYGKRNGGNTPASAWMRFGFFLLFQLMCITTNEMALPKERREAARKLLLPCHFEITHISLNCH
jgi:hypothetical protein